MPLIIRINHTANNLVLVWAIEESCEFLESRITLSDQMWERYREISSPARRVEWLISKYIIQQHLGNGVDIWYDGRQPCVDEWRVSVSHNRSLCVVMFSKDVCGVDVEDFNRDFSRVASRFLSQQEREWILTPRNICVSWCVKEALYKKIGISDIEFNEDFIMTEITPTEAIIVFGGVEHRFRHIEVGESIVCYSC